jgi:hypothetical protein
MPAMNVSLSNCVCQDNVFCTPTYISARQAESQEDFSALHSQNNRNLRKRMEIKFSQAVDFLAIGHLVQRDRHANTIKRIHSVHDARNPLEKQAKTVSKADLKPGRFPRMEPLWDPLFGPTPHAPQASRVREFPPPTGSLYGMVDSFFGMAGVRDSTGVSVSL